MTQPIQSSSTPGRNPAVSNPAMADAMTDAGATDPTVSGTPPLADSRIDKGADRVKQATSDAVERTKQAADKVEAGVHRATDKAAGAAHRANERAADLSERGREMCDDTMDKADAWMAQARDYVREKPMQSVAIAVGAGWVLGRILRR